MNTDLAKTFEDEFLSFFALYLMNLVFAALSMAIGLMIVIQQFLPVIPTTQTGIPAIPFPVPFLFGGGGFIFGLIWIMTTARLMKSVRVVRTAYKQKKRREITPDEFTGLMVLTMTTYREQKPMIRAMVIIGYIGGCCYLVLGASNVLSVITGIASFPAGQSGFVTVFAVVASVINLTIGGACILVSTYFRRYAKAWDSRLDALARSEGELEKMLGA